jgi:hypothetical protein
MYDNDIVGPSSNTDEKHFFPWFFRVAFFLAELRNKESASSNFYLFFLHISCHKSPHIFLFLVSVSGVFNAYLIYNLHLCLPLPRVPGPGKSFLILLSSAVVVSNHSYLYIYIRRMNTFFILILDRRVL